LRSFSNNLNNYIPPKFFAHFLLNFLIIYFYRTLETIKIIIMEQTFASFLNIKDMKQEVIFTNS